MKFASRVPHAIRFPFLVFLGLMVVIAQQIQQTSLVQAAKMAKVVANAELQNGHTGMHHAKNVHLTKKVYLTFDDGPSQRYTPVILNILHKEHVRATFFVLGFRTEMFPETAKRIHTEGHEIGNHGFYHTHLTGKPANWVMMDVARADTVISAACGVKPYYFRPPGGLLNPSDWQTVQSMGHKIALWTVDTEDLKAQNEKTIIDAVRTKTRPGSIILMHDGVSGSFYTALALPKVIHYLKSEGYSFDTLPMDAPHR